MDDSWTRAGYSAAMRTAVLVLIALVGSFAFAPAQAAETFHPSYASFTEGATVQVGAIPIITKDDGPYFALPVADLDRPFILTAVPASGSAGAGPDPGNVLVAPARVLSFTREGDAVTIRLQNTYARAQDGTPQALSVSENFPRSVVDVVPISAADDRYVVFSCRWLLKDIGNVSDFFTRSLGNNPFQLTQLTRIQAAHAMLHNDVIKVSQVWKGDSPTAVDIAPDPRSVEVVMTYNIFPAPDDGYRPRLADPRVGYFVQPFVDFGSDSTESRNLYYIYRWNFAPEHPGRPSVATHPLVYYIGNDVPVAYRSTIKKALLAWNAALAKAGILSGIVVKQQPDDPSWQPDDISHNMVRWITTEDSYGQMSLVLTDPRTGEELNVGININASEGRGWEDYRYWVAPALGLRSTAKAERQFTLDKLYFHTLHESGHNLGLVHNFFGSNAYTPQQLTNKHFTDSFGISSSVMGYLGLNLWPKGTNAETLTQKVLGPYDYYAIHYGYAAVPGATNTSAEEPTLRRWASKWANPLYRFASDEDTQLATSHAADPRVTPFTLSNRPLKWCAAQVQIADTIVTAKHGSFDNAAQTFEDAVAVHRKCARLAAHYIGGEYVSREPGGNFGLSPVSRADARHAWQQLTYDVFDARAWGFPPSLLRRVVKTEVHVMAARPPSWSYAAAQPVDVSLAQDAEDVQQSVLDELFSPARMRRITDMSDQYGPRKTMSLADLFNWSNSAIFADVASGAAGRSSAIRRDLQTAFARRLASISSSAASNTPADAQSLARFSLERLRGEAIAGLRKNGLDDVGRAHLEHLKAIADRVLDGRTTPNDP